MKNKQYILAVLTCLIPILAGVLLYSDLPEMMPIHFNGEGIADNYAPKAIAVFAIPLLLAALEIFSLWIMNADPKKANYPHQLIGVTIWMLPVLSCIICALMFMKALNQDVSVEVVVPGMVGVLLIVVGNYMPKIRQNYTMGIKLPWTLDSEENWRKTHRLGGFLFVLTGIWMIVSAFLKMNWLVILFPVIIVTIVPMIYSWLLYRKEGDKRAGN